MSNTKEKEHQLNILITIALLKVFSNDYSAYLIGELHKEKKHWFNSTVNASNNFIKEIESDLSEANKEMLQDLNDDILNGLINLKKDLLCGLQTDK
ncbi:MAG: hypothetical protein EKK64_07920 [Neisseriaceae bacterium]|nr:MAG: hypothetical protein EKK64_07920 [Neisseriaceae bacterium]